MLKPPRSTALPRLLTNLTHAWGCTRPRPHPLTPPTHRLHFNRAMAAPRDALQETSTTGEFVRKDSTFREVVSEAHPEFKPEAGRYRLYVSYACPWAHRTLIVRALKGLQDAVCVSVVHPTWQRTRPGVDEHCGWVFRAPSDPPVASTAGFGSFGCAGCVPDPVQGAGSIREIYELSDDTSGKYSVPVLFDTKTRKIVNNESSDIIRMFNDTWGALCTNKELDLRPKDLLDAIEEVNSWVYPGINNGVYRCGFAKSQEAYDRAIADVTAALHRLEALLAQSRYVCGSRFTEADVRLWVTLVRFDEVYIVYFKTNTVSVAGLPNTLNYCREIYQMPGVADTLNMTHIKTHYFTSHPTLNHYAIVPKGAAFPDLLSQPHDRDQKFPG